MEMQKGMYKDIEKGRYKRQCHRKNTSELWSSQLWMQLKQLRIEAWKSQDFNGVLNPWPRDTGATTD